MFFYLIVLFNLFNVCKTKFLMLNWRGNKNNKMNLILGLEFFMFL